MHRPPVELPIAREESAEKCAPEIASSHDAVSILLIDDEPKNLIVLETILNDPGYRLVRAESADAALLALMDEEFAVIVLDIQMPDMNGFELAQMIKQRRRTAAIPIIFLTAHYSEDQHVIEGYATGAVDYLHKPINSGILRSKVKVFAELFRKTRESDRINAELTQEVAQRRKFQEQLESLNMELERHVEERTAELIRINSALSQSEERLRRSQEAGEVSTWEWDYRTGLGVWSDSSGKIFGSNIPERPMRFDAWFTRIHPDDRERVTARLEDARFSGSYRDEFRIVNSDDGAMEWIEFIGAVEYQGDEPILMRGAARIITVRKQMELELLDSDRRKSEFIAILAHELRNPLAPIRNSLDVLRLASDDETVLPATIGILERQVSHIVRLVDDLLDVSRISRGKITIDRARIDLKDAVRAAISMSRPVIENAGHELILQLTDEPLFVEGDSVRLTQSVANLLNNAAKFTPSGGQITVTVAHEDAARISVRDSGIGIPTGELSQIFELFTQLPLDGGQFQSGLGIGLTLVKSLVELHGGTVQVQSPGIGLGSEFIIRIPLSEVNDVSPSPIEPAAASDRSIRNRRILIVDDNRDAAQLLGKLLQSLGAEVAVTFNGPEAIRRIPEFQPDSALLDIGMPEMNGHEVARRIREWPEYRAIKLIALTGWGQDSDRLQTSQLGFDVHLVKPVELGQLLTALT